MPVVATMPDELDRCIDRAFAPADQSVLRQMWIDTDESVRMQIIAQVTGPHLGWLRRRSALRSAERLLDLAHGIVTTDATRAEPR